MSQVARSTLTCPRCQQPFTAVIEQVVDVGQDPQAKARFLSGRLNQVTCPNCGFTMAVGTPLVYHDPAKELLLIYVPMELNLPTNERERLIGDLTRRVTQNIPQGQFKGYLLQPRQALTLPGMIDTILEADGITAEIREAQREKMRVMEMFLQVSPDQWPQMVAEQDAHIDQEFFQMLLATAESAAESGHGGMAEGLVALYNFLLQNTAVGQSMMDAAAEQEAIVQEVAEQLQSLGDQITRESFMDLVLSYVGDEEHLQALVGLIRPAMDYGFFQELTERVERADGEEREQLIDLRERLLELTSVLDQQTQAVLQRAANTLRVILNSEDIDAAIRPRLDEIDDTFLAVLQANLQAAQQRGDKETVERLAQVLQRTMEILRENAPAEIRFINDLMSAPSEAEAHGLIDARGAQFGPELIQLMDAIAQDLEDNGQDDNAARLRSLSRYAAGHVGSTP
ncbi:MAG: hypothetical protein GXY36_16940 [Chloroflexi bacterium]|nr:hypothetical protein [Chloroflexota bacterium]